MKHVVPEILAILPELAVRICLQSEEFQILFSYPKNKAALQWRIISIKCHHIFVLRTLKYPLHPLHSTYTRISFVGSLKYLELFTLRRGPQIKEVMYNRKDNNKYSTCMCFNSIRIPSKKKPVIRPYFLRVVPDNLSVSILLRRNFITLYVICQSAPRLVDHNNDALFHSRSECPVTPRRDQRPGAPSFSKIQKIWSRSEPRRSGRLSVTNQRLKAALIAWTRKSRVICAVLAVQLIIMTISLVLLGQGKDAMGLSSYFDLGQEFDVEAFLDTNHANAYRSFCVGSFGHSFLHQINWRVSPVICIVICITHLRAHDTQSVQVRSV